LPLARVVTPNLSEAAVMAEMPEISDRNAMLDAAERIAATGCASVVIKGGHSTAEPVDLLWTEGTATWLTGERIATSNTHGTGCTFSAAITANLLRGLELVDAVTAAKRYITGAIEHGQVFGRGFNPVNHFWQTNPRFGAGK
jgi:hydroxymethylpyrimidine kinase/phosphomethylpyrimidine kinase